LEGQKYKKRTKIHKELANEIVKLIREVEMKVARVLYSVVLLTAWMPSGWTGFCSQITLACGSGVCRASNEDKEGHKFWDHQRKPIPTVITGEKATQIRRHMAALFVPCSVRERKRAEKALVELVSTYKLLENSVEADATWSSPVNFVSVSNRHAVVALLHAGTAQDNCTKANASP
jgi:hypothetical protein